MEEKSLQPPPAKLAKIPESEEEQEKVIKLLEKCLEKHDENRKIVQDKLTEILNKLTEKIGELEDGINKGLWEKFSSEEDRLQAALNDLRGNSTISALQKVKVELSTIQSYDIIENMKSNNDITTLYELKTERRTVPEDGSVGFAISEVNSSAHEPSNATEMSETPCGLAKFAEERERLVELLEERLEKHDNSKKAVQDKLHEICERLRAQIGDLGDKTNKELEDKFTSEDIRLQAALNEFRRNRATSALQKAKAELLVEQSYEILENKEEEEDENDDDDEDDDKDDDDDDDDDEEEEEDEDDDDENDDDEEEDEDDNEVEEGADEEDEDENENDKVEPNFDLTTLYELKAERRIVPELTEMKKPTNVRVVDINRGSVSVEFVCLNPDEERVLSDNAIVNPVKYKCLLFKKSNEQESKKEYPLDKDEDNDSSPSFFAFTPNILEAETTYEIRVKMVVGDRGYEWSDDVAEFTTPEFKECCVWKKCPSDVDDKRKYIVDEKNPRIATKVNDSDYWCTIIGNTPIPLNTVTSWSIKVLKSEFNEGYYIYIGVAPSDINQNVNNIDFNKCGWYFYCYRSTLNSGPPHNYRGKEYGPRKKWNERYVHIGDSVGVVMDTTKSELSFVLNGVNLGVAYEGIPLDKPLVPCVLLGWKGDSVELDLSEVKETKDSSIPIPSNIIAEGITWDSIALTWDEVTDASFYQIEVDGNKLWDASTTNSFIKRGLLPETEHSFRVRTVRGSSVSEWCGVVKERTLKAPNFSECAWKKCPNDVYDGMKYSVDESNPRIATKINDEYYCTIIGNTYIPLNKVTSWSIKILKLRYSNGHGIYIGIAPSDINQNEYDNYDNCGWYFYCFDSTLNSGPPHSYCGKEYGPRKEKNGQYVQTGGSVDVVVDTTKGDLSFVLNEVNHGVVYEGIPLDKPLVPCVILCYQGDSVEIII